MFWSIFKEIVSTASRNFGKRNREAPASGFQVADDPNSFAPSFTNQTCCSDFRRSSQAQSRCHHLTYLYEPFIPALAQTPMKRASLGDHT